MNASVSVRNLIVGGAQRRCREDLGFSLADAAGVLDCDRSKLSRIETGQRGITRPDLLLLLDEYDAPAEAREILPAIASPKGWWKKHARSLPRPLTDLPRS